MKPLQNDHDNESFGRCLTHEIKMSLSRTRVVRRTRTLSFMAF